MDIVGIPKTFNTLYTWDRFEFGRWHTAYTKAAAAIVEYSKSQQRAGDRDFALLEYILGRLDFLVIIYIPFKCTAVSTCLAVYISPYCRGTKHSAKTSRNTP